MVLPKKRLFIFSLLFGCAGLGAVELPSPLRECDPAFTRLGSYTLHWLAFHVYDIALYTENKPYVTNGTAVLSLQYHISIKHKRLQETTLQEWKRLNRGTPGQRDAWIKRLDTLWPDINPGERLSAFRQQNGPTIFYFGDRLLGAVADPDFGPAFFAIWLDGSCRYPKMRDRLLGLNPDEKKGK